MHRIICEICMCEVLVKQKNYKTCGCEYCKKEYAKIRFRKRIQNIRKDPEYVRLANKKTREDRRYIKENFPKIYLAQKKIINEYQRNRRKVQND